MLHDPLLDFFFSLFFVVEYVTHAPNGFIHEPISHFKCDISHAINIWIRNGKCRSDLWTLTRRLYILLFVLKIPKTVAMATNCDYGSTLEKLLRSALTLLNDINSHFCLRKCNAHTHIHMHIVPPSACLLASFLPFRRPLSMVSTYIRTGRRRRQRATQTRIYRSSLAFSLPSHLFHIFFFYFDFLLMVR